ncbi:hypothetical protein D3C71_1738060 [compost metagenome]
MSSEVQAKWMNSLAAITSGLPDRRSFSQYSIAFTSWLVRASIAFTSSPCWIEKLSITSSISRMVAAENGFTSSMPGSAASIFSHSSSTLMRAFIRPNSEKMARSGSAWPE